MSGVRISFLLMGLGAALAEAGTGRWQLVTEQWTSLAAGAGATSGTFTTHAYDLAGRRTRTEVRVGAGPTGDPYERREYGYFTDGLPESLSIYVEGGLESRLLYAYDGRARLVSQSLTGPDGAERYRDVYAYDSEGRLAEEARWRGDARTFFRRLVRAADGGIVGDTLFEPVAGEFRAVQATAHGPGRDTSERREASWRLQGGAWYHERDVFRAYRQGLLAYAVTYPAGGKRSDSAAYAHDAEGNRVLEERFSGAGLPLSKLVLGWRDTQSNSIRLRREGYMEGGLSRPRIVISAGSGWRIGGADLLGRGGNRLPYSSATPDLNLNLAR